MAAPIFATTMVEKVGWRLTCDIVVLLTLIYGITFFFVGDGKYGFTKTY
jgi:nitrate/nitrite transporter NarK